MKFVDLGLIDYKECYQKQISTHQKIVKGQLAETVFLASHPPVITKGRNYSRKHLIKNKEIKENNVEILETDRGGSLTYHGPGQLICYPVLNLENYGKDIHRFLDMMENIVIRALLQYDIDAISIAGERGVWIKRKKIASVGIAVRRWVTYHGIAVNLNTNLDYFHLINPCGYEPDIMTSLHKIMGAPVDINQFKKHLIKSFKDNIKKTL
jgi:lipoate-protein ligase B